MGRRLPVSLRVGAFSVERDVDPLKKRATPVVRIVHDGCEPRAYDAPAFVLRGSERSIAARVLRQLIDLAPRESQLGGVAEFVAVARRLSLDAGHVTLERYSDTGSTERLEIPLAAAGEIASAIDTIRAGSTSRPRRRSP